MVRLEQWALRRASEKPTIIGLAGMAATLGYSTLGANLTSHADLIMMAAGALSPALAAASTKPRPPELLLTAPVAIRSVAASATDPTPVAPADTTKEKDMFIGSELKNVLGIVLGIVIPGASKSTTNLTTTIQNEIAKVYGEAATATARELAVDITGMTGPDKVSAIEGAGRDRPEERLQGRPEGARRRGRRHRPGSLLRG